MFGNRPVVNSAQCEFANAFDAAERVELVVLFPLAPRESRPCANRVLAFDPDSVPARIGGPNPPHSFEISLDPALARALHAFLSGRSRSLLDTLATAVSGPGLDPYLRPALRRDIDAAAGFFTYGAQAVRRLRLRHSLPSVPVSRAEIEELLAQELRASIGDFHLPEAPDPNTGILGPRATRALTIAAARRARRA